MKITKIETITADIPRLNPQKLAFATFDIINYVFTKVHTDEGFIGLGEATMLSGPTWSEESQETVKGVIDKHLARLVVGEDPFCVERILGKMEYVKGNLFAKAAIEFALFDIMGKALKVPAYQLLGGLCQEKIPLSWSLGVPGQTPEMEAKDALQLIEKGWRILKMKVAAESIEKDVERVKKVREAVGDDVKIRLDANAGWNYIAALKGIQELEKYNIDLLEQPLPRWDIDGMARLAKVINTPIMADESLCTLQDAMNIVKKDAASVFSLKMMKHGGLCNSKKVAGIAEGAGIPCYVGAMGEAGVGTAACLHFAASTKNVTLGCELFGPLMLKGDIITKPIQYEKGYVFVPKGQGLGVELDEEKLRKYIAK